MSSKRQRRPCTRDATTAPLPHIPFDLFLEIIKRSDTVTFARCAATAPDFLRAMRAMRAAGGGGRGFDPGLLTGVTLAVCDKTCTYKASPVASRPVHRFKAHVLEAFEPVASRGGIVVLRQRKDWDERSAPLRVCHGRTGRVMRIPQASVPDVYPPALLSVDDTGGSFQLLVADQHLRTQVYSSEDGKWGAVIRTRASPRYVPSLAPFASSHPVVLGRTTVPWLCSYRMIVALDVENNAQATVIDVPRECLSKMSEPQRDRPDTGVLLVASADGKLGLLVAEYLLVCMWTLEGTAGGGSSAGSTPAAPRWARQVVVQRHAIDTHGPGWPVRFLGFGDRSGAVVLLMHHVGLVEINLGPKKSRVICRGSFRDTDGFRHCQVCLHETDFFTVIRTLKRLL